MPEWVFQLLTLVGGAGAVYVAIRVDLARLGVIADKAAADASKAHARLDQLLMENRSRG